MEAASFGGLYAYLLRQDLNSVIPDEFGRDTNSAANVIGPDSARVTPLITSALRQRQSHSSISDAIRGFVNAMAQHLVLSGPATYEIVYCYPNAQVGVTMMPSTFRLESIAPGTFSKHGDTPIQYVLEADGNHWDKATGLKYIELDPETLVTFRLDRPIETAVRKLVDFLREAALHKNHQATFTGQSMADSTPHNFSKNPIEWSDQLATHTEPIGWNVRGLSKDNHLEPYEVWRQLRFLEFKVRVRDQIIQGVNAMLTDVGHHMSFEATVEIHGLPTLRDIEEAKDDLRTGRRGLRDLAKFAG
jgi:hypothetical protein